MRSIDRVQAVQQTAVAVEELADRGSRDEAYAAGVGDALAWLTGSVSARVFRGFSESMDPLTSAAEGEIPATAPELEIHEWVPLDASTGDFYSMRIAVWHRGGAVFHLSTYKRNHLAQLIGYAWAAEIRGETLGEPERVSANTFDMAADSTKSRSDDLGAASERFLARLREVVKHGTPIRKSNRAGAGTKGTRLIEPFGDVNLQVFVQ